MEVEIITKDCIKPSSPTPSHLKSYKISLLDQSMPFIYIPMILYYPKEEKNSVSKRSSILKQSLSQTLTQFYPLAGRIADDLSIECNDEGVLYVEAKANISLFEFLKNPDLNSLQKFIQNKSAFYSPTSGSYVAMIQETTFACGGTVIGVDVLHLVMDACSLASFLKAWSAMAYESVKNYPSFDGSCIFPKREDFPLDASLSTIWSNFARVAKTKSRRFVFDEFATASLKEIAKSSGVENPTRVEVVSALLSKTLMAVNHKPLAINHAVNLRRRMVPPIPECSVGNFVCLADAIFSNEETNDLSRLVCQLRKAIRKMNNDFVKNIQGDEGFSKFYEMFNGAFTSPTFSNGVEYVQFTSWASFGWYNIDFGFGKPVWISSADTDQSLGPAPFVNTILLLDARSNHGIEAWVLLDEETMAMFEKHKDLLQYASLDPSPLC